MKCDTCIYQTTPGGKQCNTMTRLLREYIGDREYTPEAVIPGLRYVGQKCKRYERRSP